MLAQNVCVNGAIVTPVIYAAKLSNGGDDRRDRRVRQALETFHKLFFFVQGYFGNTANFPEDMSMQVSLCIA